MVEFGNVETLPRDKSLPEGPYDLIVVGGGINGVAIARDAVMRGLTVALVEKNDLGSGTSGSTSKMIHGGIRYLEQLRLELVFESLRERHRLLRLAPHLVEAQSFILPIYTNSRRGVRLIRCGLWIYDQLCLGRRLGKAMHLTPEQVVDRVPDLVADGLLAGGLYWDGVMDDARMVVANAVGAREEAQKRSTRFFLRTYTEVVDEKATSPVRLTIADRLTGNTQRILAHKVVYALGPWTDRDLLVPSKGIHLVMTRFPSADGLLLEHSDDDRVFFVVPWRGLTVVGTTETPFEGNPEDVRADPDDVAYLLSELRRFFPKITFRPQDILGVYAGVRPLARRTSWLPWSAKVRAATVSRNHRILSEEDRIYRVFGGKFTTYRNVAKQVVDAVTGRGGCETHRRPLPGGEEGRWEEFRTKVSPRDLETFGESEVERLFRRYGCRARAILALRREDPSLSEPLAENVAETRGEVVYAVRNEFVEYPEDFLYRRTNLCYADDGGRQAYDAVEELVQNHVLRLPPDLKSSRQRYFEARSRDDQISGKIPTPAE